MRASRAHIEAVAVDLGDDGGGGDGERERVAVDEAGLGAGVVEPHGVDEEMVGGDGEGADGGEHGEARGLVDVDAVDGGGVDLGDGSGECGGADEAVEGFALWGCQLFGVAESGAARASQCTRAG